MVDNFCRADCCFWWMHDKKCKHGEYETYCQEWWKNYEYCYHHLIKCPDCNEVTATDDGCACDTSLDVNRERLAQWYENVIHSYRYN